MHVAAAKRIHAHHHLGVRGGFAHTGCMPFADDHTREPRDELTTSEVDVERHLKGLSPSVQSSARAAAVVLLPTEFRDAQGGYFPESTPGVLEYLHERLPEGVTAEAAVDDEDYAEYAFRSTDIVLPIIWVAQPILTSVVAGVLVDYVRSVVSRSPSEDSHVRSSLYVAISCDTSMTLHHSYDGPADAYERATENLVRLVERRGAPDQVREDPTE